MISGNNLSVIENIMAITKFSDQVRAMMGCQPSAVDNISINYK